MGFTREIVPTHYAVKEAVFPFVRFPGIDVVLTPEMKSTGEVMGMAPTAGVAFLKKHGRLIPVVTGLAAALLVFTIGAAAIAVRTSPRAQRERAFEFAAIAQQDHVINEVSNILVRQNLIGSRLEDRENRKVAKILNESPDAASASTKAGDFPVCPSLG